MSQGKKATRVKDQTPTFAVGDTVPESWSISQPSIGVIVDMWQMELGKEVKRRRRRENGTGLSASHRAAVFFASFP